MMKQNHEVSKVPEGYKQTEVGVIPEDWELYILDDVMDSCSSGATPYRGNKKFYQGTNRWITSGELNYCIIYDTLEKISDDAIIKSNLKIHPPGTFLMAITGLEAAGTRGSCAIVGASATTNQSCMAIYPNKKLSSNYLYYWYVFFGEGLAFRYCQGTKQMSYTAGLLKKIPIYIPVDKQEQTAIANVLSDVDALIAELERLIAKKEAIKTGAMQQLLTGRTRLPQFAKREDGTPKGYKNSELGEIPEDWEMKNYGEVFLFLSTSTNSRADLSDNGDYGYIHYGDIHTKWENKLDLNNDELPQISRKLVNSSFIEDGDLVIADASEDYEGIAKSIEIYNVGIKKVVAGLHTYLLRDHCKIFQNGFRGFIHENKYVKDQIDKLATGLKVYGISKSNLSKILIPIPPKKEQAAIVEILSDMDSGIEALEKRLEKTQSLKQGMMQELLTGRTRLV